MVNCFAILFCILEVLGSNLDLQTDYPYRDFVLFLSRVLGSRR
jgi:hypothetical protein